MKEKKNLRPVKEYKEIGLLIQAMLSVFLLFFTILTIFESQFLVLIEIVVGIMMFVMAYNNQTTFKRKGMTYAYLFMGTLMVVFSILLLVK